MRPFRIFRPVSGDIQSCLLQLGRFIKCYLFVLTGRDLTIPVQFMGEPFFFSPEEEKKRRLTFVGIAPDNAAGIEKSIISIDDISDEIGIPREIMVVSHLDNARTAMELSDLVRKYDDLTVIESSGIYGLDMQRCVAESSGNYIVTFSPYMSYAPSWADVIDRFIKSREKKVLYSALSIYPRKILEETGGWRGLRVCWDTDFLARVSRTFGIIFVPVEDGDFPQSFLYSTGNFFKKHRSTNRALRVNSSLLRYRDSMIACNFSFRDIIERGRLEAFSRRPIVQLRLITAYILAQWYIRKHHDTDENRYVRLAEAFLESITFKEYERFTGDSLAIRLKINPGDMNYLRKHSSTWQKMEERIQSLITT